jgi:preprotein translocase subunit SecE
MATRAVKMSGDESQGGTGSELTKKVTGTVANTREFLHDVRVEMKQVTWPSRDDVVATTGVVIATVFFFGVFLWIVDLGVQKGVSYILKAFGG